MRNIFKTVPGSRTMVAMIIMLTIAVVTMSITVFADNGEIAPADDAAAVDTVVEDTAEETAEEPTEEEAEEEESSTSPYYATVLSLLPPIVAIGLALITKEVYSSLFIGILVGGILASNFNPAGTIDTVVNDGFIASVSGSAGIFIFLVLLGILVALLNRTGASAAFGHWAKNNIKSRVGAMLATFLLGVLIFIDDYFNCLTVGSVMLPVTDSHKISRAKLSFLIDATAAPICMIAPISSWAAAVSDYAEGTGYSGLDLFIKAIPYNFYSLLTLVFIIAITLMKFDYGPMAIHEKNALEKGDLFTSGSEHAAVQMENTGNKNTKNNGTVFDLLIPIIVLIVISVIGLIYVGGFFSGTSFVDSFAGTDATVGLPWGGMIAVLLTVIYLLCRRVISFKDAMGCIPEGFKAMVPAILILTCAGTLKNMTTALGSSEFVDAVMENAAAGLEMLLPAVIFLVACFISFSTGTSWGTFGILIPIVTGIFSADSELMYIGMSACLAGSVCGDHCSPISDTSIMSSAGARCDHINHVSTQIPYAVTVAAVSFVSYIIAAFVQSWLIALPIAIILLLGTLFVIKTITVKKNA